MESILIGIAAVGAVGACGFAAAVWILVHRMRKEDAGAREQPLLYELDRLREQLLGESRRSRQESAQTITRTVSALGQQMAGGQRQLSDQLALRQDGLRQTVGDGMTAVERRFEAFAAEQVRQTEQMREMVEKRLAELQRDNARQLDQMRVTVDEKLQHTLETRLRQSFTLVGEQLEQVHKGLGEMQTLAAGVGDLKKVLSNVKTRGILGEVQLGAILAQMLAPAQYEKNVATKRGSGAVVEFAVRMPGEDEPVWLPIDAKFPADAYTHLTEAYEQGDVQKINEASATLAARLRLFAREIRDKYLDPPHTTDFGVMFLPFEGLFAEALRLGLLEQFQREFKVTITGPTTLAALLSSLQMGFQTLAIQKRSSEVWVVLGAVQTEFGRFGEALAATQQRIEQAGSELDRLVGVRTRAIQKKLAHVGSLNEPNRTMTIDDLDQAKGTGE